MTGRAHSILVVVAACLGLALPARAQSPIVPLRSQPSGEDTNSNFFSNLHDDVVQEKVNLGSCKDGLKGIPGCAETLFTGTPFHLAVGSLAPQNGMGAGIAFTEMYHPTYCASWIDFTHSPAAGSRNACHWALTVDAEGQASENESWRAGFYVTASRMSSRVPVVHFPGQSRTRHPVATFNSPAPTVSFYSENTLLNRLYFYGVGPYTSAAARTDFGFSENITGIMATVPLTGSWTSPFGLALVGEVNGRFPSVRGSYGDTTPSIETQFSEATAAGLASQPAYLQTGEGARLVPHLPEPAHLKLNYLAELQQFAAISNSHYSFRRFTTDLDHQVTLYSKDVGRPAAPSRPSPPGVPVRTIPPISPTRDVTGSVSARLLIQESIANAGRVVPFYFDPTIGGSDMNGQSMLPSYPDYRFRAPNLLLIHGAYEQSLGKIPIGLFLGIDEGKAALSRNDVEFTHLQHSYSAGLTIHAGGLPVIYAVFAWGGNEGHHTISTISGALLGSAERPSLF